MSNKKYRVISISRPHKPTKFQVQSKRLWWWIDEGHCIHDSLWFNARFDTLEQAISYINDRKRIKVTKKVEYEDTTIHSRD